MIELRWLVVRVPCMWHENGDVIAVKEEKALQYRQEVMIPVGSWTQGNEPQRRPEWTPWQDVPTVREG